MPSKKRPGKEAGGAQEPNSAPLEELPAKRASRRESTGREVGRSQILAKYWELANLDPEVTKGNITGQLKALDSLCEELGLTQAKQKAGEAPATQEIYRSAWMRARPGCAPQAGHGNANE